MSVKKLTGLQKTAIFLIVIGPQLASKLLRQFPEADIERISMEIANTGKVDVETIDEVLDEFEILNEARRYMLDGGMDYARELLDKALGPQKSQEIIRRLKEAAKVKPFTFTRNADPRQLVNIISQEHPQTIALILSYLDPKQAADVLANLPEELQGDIARRIAVMERTSPEILKGVEKVLRNRLSTVMHQGFTAAGGIQAVVDILNQVDRGTEKLILEELEKEDADLADEVRQRMFIFEDIITLDDSSIQRVLRELDSKDLALALKGSSDDVQERIFRNLSKRAGEMLREDMEYMGPVRLREVEEAQQKIVAIIRKLDENGEIILSRGGEDAIIY
ncbi:MAG: flagellar motor switch protein FliG [Firmicutes bacterium]|jgi:flagellar motor switch protein FliG|nr:flagellar motor switch protein FliG [Bacillota bacterium]